VPCDCDYMTMSDLHPVHSSPVCLIEMCSDHKPTINFRDQVETIPKIATQDTTLTVNNVDGGKTTFPVASGTSIDLHIAGLHYNRI